MDPTILTDILGMIDYAALGAAALWGAYCVLVVWRRIHRSRFRDEDSQAEFLDRLDESLAVGDFDGAMEMCEDDPRAMPQLVVLALANRDLGYSQLRYVLADRFQRDILSDLEYRLSWVQTVIKSAPMLGLFGTVLGMVGAFAKLASGDKVEPAALAGDISLHSIPRPVDWRCHSADLATASINAHSQIRRFGGPGFETLWKR